LRGEDGQNLRLTRMQAAKRLDDAVSRYRFKGRETITMVFPRQGIQSR